MEKMVMRTFHFHIRSNFRKRGICLSLSHSLGVRLTVVLETRLGFGLSNLDADQSKTVTKVKLY